MSFDDYLYGREPVDNTPLGPLETWREGEFTVIGKNGRKVAKFVEGDYGGLCAAKDLLSAIINNELTPLELKHLKAILDVMIRSTW